MNKVVLRIPDIKAVSRNETHGHYFNYRKELVKAEKWLNTFCKAREKHFDKPVDVTILAYYDTRKVPVLIKKGKHIGKKINRRRKAADTPNIDDKIFTDILVRWKQKRRGSAVERKIWFIEDDNPEHLRRVIKQSIPSDHYEVIIIIEEADDEDIAATI